MPTEKIITKELLSSLPKDQKTDPTGERLAELLERISMKKVPVSSFSRIWILGTLQAKLTCGYLAYRFRTCFADVDEKERLKSEACLAAALQIFGTMGYLRGAVMKVGQMLANLPEVVPDQFAEVLGSLHFEAPPMKFAMVREVFLNEFGREPEDVFASFDRHAFAAASLGQVHRARLHSGEEVAVKIQYPGIARTIHSDMKSLRMLLQPMRLTRDWPHLPDKLEEIEQTLLMETDYRQEARFGREIRNLFTAQDQVVVPRVYDEYCTGRVLTTEFIRGPHLEDFLASGPSQGLRDRFTHLLTMATMRLLYRMHWIPADPHPGNFIFMEDGRLGLIDFGCIRVMTNEEWRVQRECEIAMLNRDESGLNRAIAKVCLYNNPEEMEPERLETVKKGVCWQLEPRITMGLFDFGDRDFFRRGIDTFLDIYRKRYSRSKPLYLWTSRLVLGARAIAYRMKGRCYFRKIYEQETGDWK